MSSGPFALEIYNINTNLINLIEKYTTISKNFEKSIVQQNGKLNNDITLKDVNYNENLERYKFMKTYQPIILNDINVIKTNLVKLESLVVDVDNLAEEYIKIFEERYNNEVLNKLNLNTGGKKYSKKTKRNLRSRKLRKRKSVKSNKHNKKYIGGNVINWFTFDELDDKDKNEKCPICYLEFSETQEQVLYKTDCNHIFHNDCLVDFCLYKYKYINEHGTKPECPSCRAVLDTDKSLQCLYVTMFKEKKLSSETIDANCSVKAKEIYYDEDNV